MARPARHRQNFGTEPGPDETKAPHQAPGYAGWAPDSQIPGELQNDAPAEIDELGRVSYVRVLAEVILTAETPLVVAIYGGWGTGKTSMMRQLRERLRSTSFESAVTTTAGTVWFEPWMHESDENPVLGLLHQAATDLGQANNRNVKRALTRIGLAMASDVQVPFIGLRVGKVIDAVADLEFRQREAQAQLRQEFDKILDGATRAHGRIVFFIDDLDRCEPKTALRLLKALRLHLDHERCVFVLAIDRQHLESAIKQQGEDLGNPSESFLDKIVQLPFIIPAVDPDAMATYVGSRLPPRLQACETILAAIGADHPRLIKRLINVLIVTDSLVDERSFPDGYDARILTGLVLIQDQAPSLYDALRLDPTAFRGLIPSSELAQGDEVNTELSSLWLQYVAPNQRLADALRLIPLPPRVDLRPYLILASTATGSISGEMVTVRGPSIFSILFPDDGRESLRSTLQRLQLFASLDVSKAGRLALVTTLETSLRQALSITLDELILDGWSKYGAVREALDRTASTREEEQLVLTEHRLNSKFSPEIKFALAPGLFRSLDSEVHCQLLFSAGVVLLIRSGQIVSAHGTVEVAIELSLAGSSISNSRRVLDIRDALGSVGAD